MTFPVPPGSEAPDAIEMASLVSTGAVAPDHFVVDAVERAHRANPELNAIIHERYEQALELAARRRPAGPLGGVPFAVKDLGCEQLGEPHHRGTRFLRDAEWTGRVDSYLWRRFDEAGLVSLGRTNSPEFGSTITTEPLSCGPTRNPWDLTKTPGGSSGGAAALVAAGVVPLAHGNDGGGSLRVPAAMCGLVGLKPSRGRVSVGPAAGTSLGGFAVDGVVTRTVRDAAAALDVVSGYEPGDPYTATSPRRPFAEEVGRPPGRLRVGIVKRRMAADIAESVSAVAHLIDELGHEVVPDDQPRGWFSPGVIDNTTVVRAVGMARTIAGWEATLGRTLGDDDVEPQNLYAAELGRFLAGRAFADAIDDLHSWSRQVVTWWNDFDLLLSPVLGAPTPDLGFLSDPLEGQQRLSELLGFVDQANVTGQPGISLPLATDDDGLPVGAQLIAAPQREDTLLRIAAQIESAI